MKNCSVVMKSKKGTWTSPDMYTHVNGYKFKIIIFIVSSGIWAEIDGVSGEFDSLLTWPAQAKFTLQIISHNNSDVATSPPMTTWLKTINLFIINQNLYLVHHSRIHNFLYNDTLKFIVDVLLP